MTSWRLALPRGGVLELDGWPRVMGVLNLTPDSFSDGGRWLDPSRAVERGLEMAAEGAEILDLGAESTRPGGGVYGAGASEVPAEVELERLLPVLEALREAVELPLSVDTRKGAVARRALAAGADLVNDVGGLADPELIAAVAEAGCPVVVMHSRGELASMQRGIHFDDVVREVADELGAAGERAAAGGVAREQLIYDPGIGFGKTGEQNRRLIGQLGRLHELGRPILLGASRKSWIAEVDPAAPGERLGGSLAAVGWGLLLGASIVRVHDVAETVQFLRIWQAVGRHATRPGNAIDSAGS